jgi:alkylation response protein AidB-like acyl-CoA dehydrogenase
VHFAFDDDQLALRDAVSGLLDKRAGLPTLQEAWSDPAAASVWQVWDELATMGVQGLLAPESAGGSGMDRVTMCLVLAEAGRYALPLPLLETAAVAVPALVAAGDPEGLLPGLVDGSVVATAGALGSPLPSSSRAQVFVVDDRVFARDSVEVEPVVSVDRTRDAGLITARGDGIPVPGAFEEGALATAAVLVGLGRAMVQMTVDYVKDRKQFGVPVGSFQAVKHHLADAAMHVEFSAPAVWAAAWELDHPEVADEQQRFSSVSLAKALASDGATRAARIALQCHGAMGYTDDYHLHMWLKRVWCLAPAFGDAAWHRRRVGRQFGIHQ